MDTENLDMQMEIVFKEVGNKDKNMDMEYLDRIRVC